MPDHICPHVQDIGVLKRTVQRLDKEIYGNGHKGISKDITEMCLKMETMEENYETIARSISALAKSQNDSDAINKVKTDNRKNIGEAIQRVGTIFAVVSGLIGVLYLILGHI